MVELYVYTLVAQVLEATKVVRRAETGKSEKVADQMGLVEIPMLERDLFRARATDLPFQGLVETARFDETAWDSNLLQREKHR